MMVDIKWSRVTGIEYENRVQMGTEMRLKHSVNRYELRYNEAEQRCLGVLEFRIADEELRPFSIKVTMEALFTYEEGDDRADIHVASFDQLFPFLRQTVHSVTAMSGMAGLMLPMMHLKKTSVVSKMTPPSDDSLLN
ncbi:MAG: hypothetical protein IJ168_00320 [Eubacterium sp.]|nr:hypothetical protein [Eubacterium sp.]